MNRRTFLAAALSSAGACSGDCAPWSRRAPASSVPGLAGIFPPVWKVGDTWGVTWRVTWPMDVPIHFFMRVERVPADATGRYCLLAGYAMGDDYRRHPHYFLYYQKSPFAFAGLEEKLRIDGSLQREEVEPGPFPHIGRAEYKLLEDFPVEPAPPPPRGARRAQEADGRRVQLVEVHDDVAHFTLRSTSVQVDITWRRGDPWWTTLDRSDGTGDGRLRR